ncbi:MAG TPA: DUF3788 family protein [Chitinophagales bacterium]|nr:DUF3788 family protein [Chitinophagales bacterium]
MKSIFADRKSEPTQTDLKNALGNTFEYWTQLANYTHKSFTAAKSEWYFSGEKYGWSFRISDHKRVLIYLLPRDKFFKVAFVFGKKATDEIMSSKIADSIKTELRAAKAFAEGRGIRLDVKNKLMLDDIQKLIAIKLAN